EPHPHTSHPDGVVRREHRREEGGRDEREVDLWEAEAVVEGRVDGEAEGVVRVLDGAVVLEREPGERERTAGVAAGGVDDGAEIDLLEDLVVEPEAEAERVGADGAAAVLDGAWGAVGDLGGGGVAVEEAAPRRLAPVEG